MYEDGFFPFFWSSDFFLTLLFCRTEHLKYDILRRQDILLKALHVHLSKVTFYHSHDIHGWKATDHSLALAPSDQNLKHPTSRQNFGDGPG